MSIGIKIGVYISTQMLKIFVINMLKERRQHAYEEEHI